jgi:hypothetical protein
MRVFNQQQLNRHTFAGMRINVSLSSKNKKRKKNANNTTKSHPVPVTKAAIAAASQKFLFSVLFMLIAMCKVRDVKKKPQFNEFSSRVSE